MPAPLYRKQFLRRLNPESFTASELMKQRHDRYSRNVAWRCIGGQKALFERGYASCKTACVVTTHACDACRGGRLGMCFPLLGGLFVRRVAQHR